MKGHSSCNHHSSAQRRRPWTPEEDLRLRKCIEKYGQGNWHLVPSKAGIKRCRKSCRLRWFNYLCPNIKRGEFGDDEDDLIIRLHKLLGNRWSLIAGRLPGRTANDVKNHWNCHLRKKIDDHEKATPRRVEVIKPQPHIYIPSSIRPKDLQLPRNQHHPENEMAMSMSMTPSWDTDESTKWWDSLLGKEEDETLFFGNSTTDEVVEEQPSSSWFEGIEPISQTDGVLLAGVCGWDDFSSDTGFCSDWLDMP